MSKYEPGDEQETLKAIANPANKLSKTGDSWLRHSDGAGGLDRALLLGATMEQLTAIRKGVGSHLGHLRKIHNVEIYKDKKSKKHKIIGAKINGVITTLESKMCEIEGFNNIIGADLGEIKDVNTAFESGMCEIEGYYNTIEDDLTEIGGDSTISETQKGQLINARLGQGKYRSELMIIWNDKCAITGVGHSSLLRASHIKPWSVSDNSERLNPANGLLLTANYDAVFDKGYISFDETGKIIISNTLSDDDCLKLGIDKNAKINLTDGHKAFLKYHTQEVFKK